MNQKNKSALALSIFLRGSEDINQRRNKNEIEKKDVKEKLEPRKRLLQIVGCKTKIFSPFFLFTKFSVFFLCFFFKPKSILNESLLFVPFLLKGIRK
jgi:hypothetical protein